MHSNFIKKLAVGSIVCSVLTGYAMPSIAYTNEESVYSNLKPNGEAYKTTASVITGEGKNTKVTQKEIDKDLPIECQVTYKLYGKEMTAEEIAGKEGKVTISLKYVNKDEKSVWVNGKNEKMYTPFLVISGVTFDNKNNKNIEINHGKLINNGETTIAAGFAIPGVVESLKLDNEYLDNCDTIEITLDTDCFELKNVMTFASPKVFDSLNIKLDSFNDLFNKVNELQNASSQIENGATELNNGIILLDNGVTTLKNGTVVLKDGVNTLKQGAIDLNNGAVTLKDGINEYSTQTQKFNQAVGQVSAGTDKLNSNYILINAGINSLNENSSDLESGANMLAEGSSQLAGGISNLSQKLSGAASSTTEIDGGVQTVKQGIDTIVESMESQMSSTSDEVPQTIQDNIALISELTTANETLSAKLEDETLDESMKEIISNQITMNSKSIQKLKASNTYVQGVSESSSQSMATLYSNLKSLQTGINGIAEGTTALKNGLNQMSEGSNTLATKSADLVEGAGTLHQGTEELVNGTEKIAKGSNDFSAGLQTLSEGTSNLAGASNKLTTASATIAAGANSLQSGTESLMSGTNTLSNGTDSLVQGVNSLSDGSKQLVDGSGTLVDGIKRFNAEGIDSICNLINNDGKNLIRRIEKLEELSRNYDAFASDEERDNLQFISIMDSVTAPDTESKKNK